jgi:hypothetical protein
MKAAHGFMRMTPRDYKRLRKEYLSWIDARVKADVEPEDINKELRAAGVLSTERLDTADEMETSRAGYVSEIKQRVRTGSSDVLVIEAGMYRGAGCSNNVTAILYDRKSKRRLAQIDAVPNDPNQAYYLSGLAVGARDSKGQVLVASGWVASNCTSTWNGKSVRIDRASGSPIQNLLARTLYAHDREPEDTVAVEVDSDVVTFRYDGGLGDSDLLWTPMIARFRVLEKQAIREQPFALTIAGFIHEWITATGELGRPDTAGMAELRTAASQAIARHGFEWKTVARCSDSSAPWEVGIKVRDTERSYFFRVSGSHASDLRMLSISEKPVGSCIHENSPEKGLEFLATELPW